MNKSDKKNLIVISIIFILFIIFMFLKYYSIITNSTYYIELSNIKDFFNIGKNNIYYYIYLGMYNFSTYLSLLIPFNIKYFVIGSNILYLYSSIILFYYFLKDNKFNSRISFFGTICFIVLTSYFSNIFKEIIYLNYLPFLILSLIGVNKYIKNNNKWLISLSLFLLGIMNYKYLFISVIVLIIYYIYKSEFNYKNLFKYLLLLLILCLILSFEYLPILLYNYEGYINNNEIRIPLIFIISIVLLFFKNKFLSIILIISLILNIVFSIDISVFIPLYILSLCILFNDISLSYIYRIFGIVFVLILFFDNNYSYYLEFIISFIVILSLNKNNKLYLVILIYFFIFNNNLDYKDNYLFYEENNNYIKYYSFNNKEFNKYSFPYKNELLMKYVIVSNSNNKEYTTSLKRFYINNSNIIYVSSDIKNENNLYIGNGSLVIDVSKIKDKLLLIKSNNIKVNNNIVNDDYLFLNESDTLEITFTNELNINDIICFYMDNIDDYSYKIENINTINLDKDAYIVTKYKYDLFFNIKVDNKKISYYKVNNDMVGFKVPKGEHKISISYFSYYIVISFIISLINCFMYIYFVLKKEYL